MSNEAGTFVNAMPETPEIPDFDSEMGLARCGCGGPAAATLHMSVTRGFDRGEHSYSTVVCLKCGIETRRAKSKEVAKEIWNKAMGFSQQWQKQPKE